MNRHRLGALAARSGHAAVQAAGLFALSGLLAILAIPSTPGRELLLTGVGVADLVTAGIIVSLPWTRWPASSTAVITIPAMLIIGVSTYAFGGFAAGTGPFYVLFFAWLGLHQSVREILASAPLLAASYAGPLAFAGEDARLIGSTVVLVPIAVGVALVIQARVRALARAHDVIVNQERWRASVVATLAHDVRTPLTALKMSLELLDGEPDLTPESRDLVALASRQATTLTDLAESLLDYERIEHGKLRLDLRPVPVAELAESLVARGIVDNVKIEVPPDLEVVADPTRLEQILVNLTANAMRHGSPPVVIGGAAHEGSVRLWVRDHGPGVPAECVHELFQRFGGAASSGPGANRANGSVGLGLWIVRLLTNAHGGEVHYEDASPGARFVVELPAPAGETWSG